MKICYIAAEIAPLAKTGGLADVGFGLPKSLAKRGHQVHAIMPCYRRVKPYIPDHKKALGRVTVHVDGIPTDAIIYRITLPGTEDTGAEVSVDLIDCPSYFDRDGLYGESGEDYTDNLDRFVFFCRAALQWMIQSNWQLDIIHANDWHSSLIPTYLRTESNALFDRTRVVYTIHNLAYQGLFPKSRYSVLGLPWDLFHLDALEFYNQINLTKGGIIFSDIVTTVSPAHSREIQTKEFGCGLDGLLSSISHRLTGIINGCDTDVWNPRTDAHIAFRYDETNLIEGKHQNKRALLQEFGLEVDDPDRPLFGVVSRLESLKGMDLLASEADAIVQAGGRLVLLGTGDATIEAELSAIAEDIPKDMAVRLAYDEGMAHRIFAAADFFLMPSRFEPCGLAQMYAMRYGTLPIVNSVGGLVDSVFDIDTDPLSTERGNGFRMESTERNVLLHACQRAMLLSQNPERRWEIAQRAMKLDHSWDRSAQEYEKLFSSLCESSESA